MVILYTSPGCASCRKAKKWLKEHDMDFVEKNIFTNLLKEDEIRYLLKRSENGTEDLISTRSKAFQELHKDLDDFTVPELVEFIQNNPSVMRRPIIIDESRFVVGYDDDEITAFIPSKLRQISEDACNESCPRFEECGRLRAEGIEPHIGAKLRG